jgi:hypothetical protein
MGTTADLTPKRAAAAATLAMRRRPTKTIHDLHQAGPQRALTTFKQLQPKLAARYADAALLVAAQGKAATLVCRWHLARALASRHGLPAPRFTADHRALLGKPCDPACRAQIDPKPRPKPKPKAAAAATRPREAPARAAPPGRRLPATPAEVMARLAAPRLSTTAAVQRGRVIHYVSGGTRHSGPIRPARPAVPDTPSNRAAAHRLGLDPARIGWRP